MMPSKKKWHDHPKSIAEVIESIESLGFRVVNKPETMKKVRAKLRAKKIRLRRKK